METVSSILERARMDTSYGEIVDGRGAGRSVGNQPGDCISLVKRRPPTLRALQLSLRSIPRE